MKGLLLVVFVNFVGVGALIPVLPFAVIDEAGGNETIMALLMASFAFAMFIGSPVLGVLSDRIGRKKVLVGAVLTSTIAHLIFALTTDLTTMFVARIMAGFGAGNISVIQAIVTDNTSAEDRAKWMGFIGAFIGFGFVAGPAMGGLLSGYGGAVHTAPFLLASGLAFIGFVLAMVNVQDSVKPVPKSPRQFAESPFAERWGAFRQTGLLAFAVASFLLNLAFAQVEVSFVLVLKDLLDYTSRNTGWVFTWIGILIVVIQGGLIGPVTRRLTDLGTALMGAGALALGQLATVIMVLTGLGLVSAPTFTVLVCTSLVCIGFGFSNPTMASAASKQAVAGQVGGSMGFVQGFGSLGQVGGLIIAGPLYQYGGGSLTFGAGAVICFGLILSLLWIMMRRNAAVATL